MTAGIAPKQHFLLGRTLSLEEEKRKTNSPICFGKKKTTTTTTQASALSHNALASVSVAVMNKESIALFLIVRLFSPLSFRAHSLVRSWKRKQSLKCVSLCALFRVFLGLVYARVFVFDDATTVVFDFIWIY